MGCEQERVKLLYYFTPPPPPLTTTTISTTTNITSTTAVNVTVYALFLPIGCTLFIYFLIDCVFIFLNQASERFPLEEVAFAEHGKPLAFA